VAAVGLQHSEVYNGCILQHKVKKVPEEIGKGAHTSREFQQEEISETTFVGRNPAIDPNDLKLNSLDGFASLESTSPMSLFGPEDDSN
jgi:hypothetical protein